MHSAPQPPTIADTVLLPFPALRTGQITADTLTLVESKANDPLWYVKRKQICHFFSEDELVMYRKRLMFGKD